MCSVMILAFYLLSLFPSYSLCCVEWNGTRKRKKNPNNAHGKVNLEPSPPYENRIHLNENIPLFSLHLYVPKS